jgi:hypothetical protein
MIKNRPPPLEFYDASESSAANSLDALSQLYHVFHGYKYKNAYDDIVKFIDKGRITEEFQPE